MTEAFSDTVTKLKSFIKFTIAHPSSQNLMTKWNTNNPQRGIPCTYCVETKRPCRSLATRINCSSRSCSQNGEPCSRINEELFDRVKAAYPDILRSDFDIVMKQIRSEEPSTDTSRLQQSLLAGALNDEMDIASTSTSPNDAGSSDTPAVPEITSVAASPVCSESAGEITSSTEALNLADPFANLGFGLPGKTTTTTNPERHGRYPQIDAPPTPECDVSATKKPFATAGASSSIAPWLYYQPLYHIPSARATSRYSYTPFSSFPSQPAAQSDATTNAAADLEQRILALIAEKDAAVATNAENAARMQLLEAAAAELKVVLEERNALQSRNDILEAENTALQLEKDSVLAEKNTYEVRYNTLKGDFYMLQPQQRYTASVTEPRDLDKRIAEDEDSHFEVQVAALREELEALERQVELHKVEEDASSAKIAELEGRVRAESDQRNILQTLVVDLTAKIKTLEDSRVQLLGTINDLQNELAAQDHRKHHLDELENSNTKLSKALRGQERKLIAMRNQNNKYQRSIVFQHLAISKLRDGLSHAYRAARDDAGALPRLCSVVSTHLAELKKLEIWLLEQTPMTYDEIVKMWVTDDHNVEVEDDAVSSNDGASRAKKRQRGVD